MSLSHSPTRSAPHSHPETQALPPRGSDILWGRGSFLDLVHPPSEERNREGMEDRVGGVMVLEGTRGQLT